MIVYDTETYPNCYQLGAYDMLYRTWHVFELSPFRDDLVALRQAAHHWQQQGRRMVGFNNLHFDYPILHRALMQPSVTDADLYAIAHSIIKGGKDEQFGWMVWPNDRLIAQVDLFKIHHFDNIAKSTSLKVLEFNMRSPFIEDLPFPPGTELTRPQMDSLREYMLWDISETAKFLQHSEKQITFRDELTEKYQRDFTNHNDTKIGKDYFIMRLEQGGVPCFERNPQTGRREPRQTVRESINLGDLLLPYIAFRNPELQAVQHWIERQTITRTKGVFTDITERRLGPLAQYCDLTKKRQRLKANESFTPDAFQWEEKASAGRPFRCWRQADKLHTYIDGFRFDFGTGGLHGSIESAVVRSDAEYAVIDLDVSSYYPSLAIANGMYPAHLGPDFVSIYGDIKRQRKQYAKGTAENAMLKLALNGTFGDTNSPYSPFYDPAYTMGITVNGQLLLCMLAENLMTIPGLQMIQANTDGVTVRCRRDMAHCVDNTVNWWEQLTGLDLERADYSAMFIRDVNNYLAVYEDGSVKRKGAYAWITPHHAERLGADVDVEWHKDHSALVVPMAAEAALRWGVPVREFIAQHADPFDFMIRAKAPRSSYLMHGDQQIQNTSRVYVAHQGAPLVKHMPPLAGQTNERKIGICSGWKVDVCNDMSRFQWANLNREYYIQEAEKLLL